jgi:RNA polymerase sigma-70 factor (family 1)
LTSLSLYIETETFMSSQELSANTHHDYEVIFRSYYERLCHYANMWLKDMDASEEVVQNTFVKLWEKRDSIKVELSVKSYLYRAVYNASINEIKHQKVKDNYANMHNNHEPSNELHSQSELKELESRIEKALKSLPEQCRLIFQMSRYQDLKYREIADILNISIKTVENQMGKALKMMRMNLSDYLAITIISIQTILEYTIW